MYPLIAYAGTEDARVVAQCLVDQINKAILFPLIALLVALAFMVFLYAAFEFVKNADNDGARETGRLHLLYGTIGLLVMLSAYAILSVAAGSFGILWERVECNPAVSSAAISGGTLSTPISATPTTSTGDFSFEDELAAGGLPADSIASISNTLNFYLENDMNDSATDLLNQLVLNDTLTSDARDAIIAEFH